MDKEKNGGERERQCTESGRKLVDGRGSVMRLESWRRELMRHVLRAGWQAARTTEEATREEGRRHKSRAARCPVQVMT